MPGLKLQLRYLLITVLDLDLRDAGCAYDGRKQIEFNMDAVKELSLGHEHG
jgi:hypothetical protein